MAREWAAVELLECVGDELSPDRHVERASQTKLEAIRVLPAPVAGDLFVTNAARGDIGVILFYFEEGELNTLQLFERQLAGGQTSNERAKQGRAHGREPLPQLLRTLVSYVDCMYDRTKRKNEH